MRTYCVAICGGRDHEITQEEEQRFLEALAFARVPGSPETAPRVGRSKPVGQHHVVLLHGNCRGVDRRAAELAESWGYPTVPFEAPWDFDFQTALGGVKLGPAAGPLRNWMMLQAADLLIAFPGGRGTADCVRQAEKKGIEVVRVGGGGYPPIEVDEAGDPVVEPHLKGWKKRVGGAE